MPFVVTLANTADQTLRIRYNMVNSQQWFASGVTSSTVILEGGDQHTIELSIVALSAGLINFPKIATVLDDHDSNRPLSPITQTFGRCFVCSEGVRR